MPEMPHEFPSYNENSPMTLDEAIQHALDITENHKQLADWLIELKNLKEENQAKTANVIRCKDCKHFERNSWANFNGIPLIVAHEICTFWGNGCKTNPEGYCFAGEISEEGDSSVESNSSE